MDLNAKLLWVDGTAGALVGMLLLGLSPWLAALLNLPFDVVLFMGVANLVYGCCALTTIRLKQRPLSPVRFLVIANLAWMMVCIGLAIVHSEGISVWGLLHLSASRPCSWAAWLWSGGGDGRHSSASSLSQAG